SLGYVAPERRTTSVASLALYSVAALVVGFVVVAVLIAMLSPAPPAQPAVRSVVRSPSHGSSIASSRATAHAEPPIRSLSAAPLVGTSGPLPTATVTTTVVPSIPAAPSPVAPRSLSSFSARDPGSTAFRRAPVNSVPQTIIDPALKLPREPRTVSG